MGTGKSLQCELVTGMMIDCVLPQLVIECGFVVTLVPVLMIECGLSQLMIYVAV